VTGEYGVESGCAHAVGRHHDDHEVAHLGTGHGQSGEGAGGERALRGRGEQGRRTAGGAQALGQLGFLAGGQDED